MRTSIEPPGGVNLTRVREHVPDRSAERDPVRRDEAGRRPERASRIVMFLACAVGVTTSIAASVDGTRSTGLISSRSLPLTMRAMSSMSSISRACAAALRSMTCERALEHLRIDRLREQDVGPAEHRVERRPELVRQRGEEFVLRRAALFRDRPRAARRRQSAGATRLRCSPAR